MRRNSGVGARRSFFYVFRSADPEEEPTFEGRIVAFKANPTTLDPSDPFFSAPGPLFQVAGNNEFDQATRPNPFTGPEGEVNGLQRTSIIEFQKEVNTHEEAIASMLQTQTTLATDIRANTASICDLTSRVDAFGDDIQKNTAGIGLAFAFPSSGLNCLSGGAGYFRDEAAVAFGFTGRLSQNVTASGGVGLADGVSGARIEIGYGW